LHFSDSPVRGWQTRGGALLYTLSVEQSVP